MRVALLDHGGVRFPLIEVFPAAGERDEASRGSSGELVRARERDELLDICHRLLAGEARSDGGDVVRFRKGGLEQRRRPEPVGFADETVDHGDDSRQREGVVGS